MSKDGNLSEIGEEKLKELIGGGVDDMMKRNEHSHEVKNKTLPDSIHKYSLKIIKRKMNDLEATKFDPNDEVW